MRKSVIYLFLCIIIMSCKDKKNTEKSMTFKYPHTEKKPVIDDYFGTKITDNYRWLEDDRSSETENWVKEQNNVTSNYLNQISYSSKITERLSSLWNYEKITTPFKEGDYTYFYKNNGLQNHYVLFRKGENDKEEIVLDPNTFSKDGTTSLGNISFSKNGKILAYAISEGGSDWRKIIIMDTDSKKIIEDTLVDIKFSEISWKDNDGFFYSSYDKPEGSELSAKTDQHKLYYHKIGTPQSEDTIIFGGNKDEKHRYVGGTVTKDGNYLFISAANSTSGNKLFIKDLSKKNSKIIPITENFNSDTHIIENIGSKLYLVTNLNAPNKKIITVDANNPSTENWKDFIAETENVLTVSKGGNYFFTNYMTNAVSKVLQYDYNGKLIREIELPGIGTATGFTGKKRIMKYILVSLITTPLLLFIN